MKIIKNKVLKKNIKNYLSQEKKTKKKQLNCFKNCVFLVDLEEFLEFDFFLELSSLFSVSTENITIIGFKNKEKGEEFSEILTFSWKDIDFSGQINKTEFQEVFSKEYDVLINYFSQEKIPLLWASTQIKANLKVGMQGIYSAFSDIIIAVRPFEKEVFRKELEKIIKILQ